ncbi:MAG TPA: hypothetical protein VLH84_06075 [Patescibacteria group bacterium]|nr:hypothetical protein [Patescibacteria group bacterium]
MKQQITYYTEKLTKSKMAALLKRHPRRSEFAVVSLFFGALAALFMGPILFHFGSAVHGFWGDGTGGLIWLGTLHLGPFGGTTHAVLYPYGENLFRPDLVTSFFLVVPFWVFTKIMGAVAAWNFMVLVSFYLCGVGMYYLAKRVTHSRQAALWAGVAFAYLPMHQYKAFGQIGYVMTFVFVYVLWQLINFWERPTRKHALLLGLATAVPFYVDGYYVLFTMILVGPPLVFLMGKGLWQLSKQTAAEFKALLINLSLLLGTTVVLLLPIIYVKLVYGAQIAAELALARGDFIGNVIAYTARWYDYVLPILTHPVFGAWVTNFRATHTHGSNPSEYTMYLGLVLVGLVIYTMYYFWKRRGVKKLKETRVNKLTIGILLLIAGVAFVMTLPPYVRLHGHRLPLPTGVLSKLVQYWRVYSRLVLLIDVVLLPVAATGLAILLKSVHGRAKQWGLLALVIFVTLFEYLSFNPFHRHDIWYYGNLSSANTWLAQQRDVSVIADYPLVDEPAGEASLYTTEQQVNHKQMINAGSITAVGAPLRASIMGLNDPQTLPVLKALGVQAIMTHEIPNDVGTPGLVLAYSASVGDAGYAHDVNVFKIAGDIPAAKYALVAQAGFTSLPQPNLTTNFAFDTSGLGLLRVLPMPGVSDQQGSLKTISFVITSLPTFAGNDIVLSQSGHVIDTIHLTPGQQLAAIYNVNSSDDVRMQIIGSTPSGSVYITGLGAQPADE